MKMVGESLAERMKSYEPNFTVLARIPKVIRLDGRAFGSVLRNVKDTFDPHVIVALNAAATAVMQDIGGTARMAYIQSDECSIILNDGLDVNTQAWFGNDVQKITSISASIYTKHFAANYNIQDIITSHAYFDSRLVTLPSITELNNYLVWRQKDAIRNSVSKYARIYFSHKEIDGCTSVTLRDKLIEKGYPWEELALWKQRGLCIIRGVDGKFQIDWNIPLFSEQTTYSADQFIPKT